MGVLKISYSALSGAIKGAERASKEAESYAKELDKKVCKRISNLEGGGSDNVNNADYFVKKKIEALNEKAEKLKNFAERLNTFCDNVKETDKNVGDKFSELYNQFKKDNGLKINAVTEFFSYIGTRVLNSTDFGRWLNNMSRSVGDFFNDIWGEIKYWYKCEGGKYVVDRVLSVAAICLAVITICTAGAGFFAVVAIIGAVITIVNALNDIGTSAMALYHNNEDPAWANRYGKMDKLSDTLRKRVDSRYADFAANVLDATKAFCDIVGFVKLGKDILKASKHTTALKNLFGDKNNGLGKAFLSDTKNKENYVTTFKSFQNGLKTLFTDKNFRSELARNFRTDFLKDIENITDSLKSVKNLKFKDVFDIGKKFIDRQWDEAWKHFGKAKDFDGKVDFLNIKYQMSKGATDFLKVGGMVGGVDKVRKSIFELKLPDVEKVSKVTGIGKKESSIETIVDVFKPESYKTKYGIKRMTPTGDMLKSVEVFAQ